LPLPRISAHAATIIAVVHQQRQQTQSMAPDKVLVEITHQKAVIVQITAPTCFIANANFIVIAIGITKSSNKTMFFFNEYDNYYCHETDSIPISIKCSNTDTSHEGFQGVALTLTYQIETTEDSIDDELSTIEAETISSAATSIKCPSSDRRTLLEPIRHLAEETVTTGVERNSEAVVKGEMLNCICR